MSLSKPPEAGGSFSIREPGAPSARGRAGPHPGCAGVGEDVRLIAQRPPASKHLIRGRGDGETSWSGWLGVGSAGGRAPVEVDVGRRASTMAAAYCERLTTGMEMSTDDPYGKS